MPRALSRKQAEEIASETELQQARLEARETEAIEEIAKLGFRVTLHEMGQYVEGDDLLGIVGGYKAGDCYAVMYGRDGKRKHVSASSAVQALQDAQTWLRFQATLKDDSPTKFVPSVGNEFVPERIAIHKLGGQALSDARKAIHRTLEFSPTGELIDVKESK